MAFTVKLCNANLPKRLNLLRSKGDFAGKSGRITPNSIQNDVERPAYPRVVDGWLRTGRNLAPVGGVLHVLAGIADRYANGEKSHHGRTSQSTGEGNALITSWFASGARTAITIKTPSLLRLAKEGSGSTIIRGFKVVRGIVKLGCPWSEECVAVLFWR